MEHVLQYETISSIGIIILVCMGGASISHTGTCLNKYFIHAPPMLVCVPEAQGTATYCVFSRLTRSNAPMHAREARHSNDALMH